MVARLWLYDDAYTVLPVESVRYFNALLTYVKRKLRKTVQRNSDYIWIADLTALLLNCSSIVDILLQAASINVHPLYVTLPATMAAAYAFMLPAATPVNAIVFSHGHVSVLDMVRQLKNFMLHNRFCVGEVSHGD